MNQTRRRYLAASAALPLIGLLEGCANLPGSRYASANAAVDASHGGASGALVSGIPTYKRLQDALDAAPANGSSIWRIRLTNGRYYEKVIIDKPHISLVGESRDKTILSFDAYSGLPKAKGTSWGTFGCATLMVRASDFSAENLTVENGFDYPTNDARDVKDPAYIREAQAVALMTDTGADRSFFNNVKIIGYQDTLFTNVGLSYFKNCTVSGHVDFIFGAGQSVFEGCQILTRPRTKPGLTLIGYVTAPSTNISNKYGFVFIGCKLAKESDKVPAESSPLGRPWHPTVTKPDGRYADPDAIGSSIFIECHMADHITAEGWSSMAGTQKSGPDRAIFQPEDARFFEYKNSGPGAKTGTKRRQLTDAQAADYTVEKLLGAWYQKFK